MAKKRPLYYPVTLKNQPACAGTAKKISGAIAGLCMLAALCPSIVILATLCLPYLSASALDTAYLAVPPRSIQRPLSHGSGAGLHGAGRRRSRVKLNVHVESVLTNHGLNPDRDVVFLDPGAGNQLFSLLAGTVDAAILGAEQRYTVLGTPMREQIFLGREVRNSWEC